MLGLRVFPDLRVLGPGFSGTEVDFMRIGAIFTEIGTRFHQFRVIKLHSEHSKHHFEEIFVALGTQNHDFGG